MVLFDIIILVKTYDDDHDDDHGSELDEEREEELIQLARWTW